MKCLKCKYEFCWLCLGSYKGYRHVDNYTCELVTTVRVTLYLTLSIGVILKVLVLIPWGWTLIYWMFIMPISYAAFYGLLMVAFVVPHEIKR
jgi:hypothetical protein